MKKILRFKWIILIGWVVFIAILVATMPNLDNLVREKGQTTIPDGYMSKDAEQLLKAFNKQSGNQKETNITVVFNEKGKMTDDQLNDIETGVNKLKAHKQELGITDILAYPDNKDAKNQLVSKDGTTVLAVLTVRSGQEDIETVRNKIENELKSVPVRHELTGSDLIMEDFIKTTQAGVKSTETVAVIFIILILIVVFRSPITPIVSLISVAVAYLASLGIVTQLVDQLNFPYSNFTQIFLVLVLFGIGTDYNILLFSRFKEELSRRENVTEAIVEAYKTAGKTVLFSGLTVFIGFSGLGFASFQLFKSASAVGIGVGVLLFTLFTIVPILMALLGGKLFWPFSNGSGHRENKWLSSMTRFATKRTIWGMLIALAICVPFLFFYNSQLSYNSLKEISQDYSSIKGISIVNDHFPKGQALPTNLILKSSKPMDNSDALAFIDQVTGDLQSVKGVDKVYSTTRPQGDKISDLYTNNQNLKSKDAISQASDGIVKVQDGLNEMITKIGQNPDDTSRVDELISGTKKIQLSVDQSADALGKINQGIGSGASGAKELQKGVSTLNDNIQKLNQSTESLSSGLKQLESGYGTLYSNYGQIEQSVQQLTGVSQSMNGYITLLGQSHPDLNSDKNYVALKQTSATLSQKLTKMQDSLSKINSQFAAANNKLSELSQGAASLGGGQQQIAQGLDQVNQDAGKLANGLEQSSSGQQKVISGMSGISDGLDSINNGQEQLKNSLDTLSTNMSQLENGLKDSVKGLDSINDVLTQVGDYLDKASKSDAADTFYIPEDQVHSKDMTRAMNAFMSYNRKSVKWTIVLSVDPYSAEAMDIVDHLNQKYQNAVKNTSYEKDSYGIAGVSSQNNDLDTMNRGDFAKAASIMLIGILIVLIIITRSLKIPLIIISCLTLAYFTALSFTTMIFGHFTSHPELTWTIPFFSFIMIVALGVDYSIFLMMRYKEYGDLPTREAIVEAMKHVGGVILSAAIILSGTFAAMYPSNVLTLTQMATTVIFALMLLAIVLLPMLLPSLLLLTDRKN